MSEDIDKPLYCANHPNRKTYLRCNHCGKPICTECAIQTPTGYRCKECVRGQQKLFENAIAFDYVLTILVAGILAFAGSFIVGFIGFFTILLAPAAGAVIAAAVRGVTGRRRSKRLFQLAAAAAVIGSLPLLVLQLFHFSLFSVLWQGLYTFLMTSTLYYRLSGIQIGL
jgi:hypothetical protein